MPVTDRFVAASDAARSVLREVAQAARTSMPVLLTGETGTGKEVAARLLHEWSPRRTRRFIPINCAAIPNELIEAELFGYAKGAFTGSVRAYEGQLTAAEGGTVFLDEVDDTPLPFQVKLLRVLEDRVVSRIGENASHVVDFRILAATNRDLRPLCADGRVRRRPLRAPGDRVDPDAAAARAHRGPARAGRPTSRSGSTARSRTRRRGTRSRARRRPRWRRCARTRGRATSASCAT